MRSSGRARVDTHRPQAFAICDRCGFRYNHVALRWQNDYRGTRLTNLRLLVCDRCLDNPQPQLKPKIIGQDPISIKNARPDTYASITTSVTATYAILSTDQLVSCSGTFTVTLPTAVTTTGSSVPPVTVGTNGKTVTVQNNGTGIITVATTGGQTIEGASTYVLDSGEEIAVYSNGANWRTI